MYCASRWQERLHNRTRTLPVRVEQRLIAVRDQRHDERIAHGALDAKRARARTREACKGHNPGSATRTRAKRAAISPPDARHAAAAHLLVDVQYREHEVVVQIARRAEPGRLSTSELKSVTSPCRGPRGASGQCGRSGAPVHHNTSTSGSATGSNARIPERGHEILSRYFDSKSVHLERSAASPLNAAEAEPRVRKKISMSSASRPLVP